ncbi:insulinase family protein [Shewanella alkalitolerans]|uniref:M16 family metallopeptidase n=1 Tax=Shewanella alkalitolerans TaxID=2864209 RepID=UPI001C6553BA|nr:pitrilysin family protein [Shewanella alkalitolerans]QYJ98289.1 insulinase family protein [Shewanella alkalitolerans]
MPSPTRYSLLASLLSLIGVSVSAMASEPSLETLAAPLYQLEQQLSRHELDNGLSLYLLVLPNKQSVALSSQFAVGSRNELEGESGYAHLFEHMLFKGSENAPGDSYGQTMSANSGYFNASTFFDATNYYVNLPSQALELALWLESDRFIRPLLSDETVRNQQQTVLEEMATTIDNQPYIRPAMTFLLNQVKGSPYGHAVIGSVDDVSAATPASLNRFHHDFYRPDAMQLAIVGDLPPQALSWVDKYFGSWQKPKRPQAHFSPLAVERQPVRGEIVDSRGPWPGLMLAWHTVGALHPDAAAITLVEDYLLQNRTSMLEQMNLKAPDTLLHYSVPLSMEHLGVMNLILVPRAKISLDDLSQRITGMVDTLASQGVTPLELDQLKRHWLLTQLSKLDNDVSLANLLSASQQRDREHPLTAPWERIAAVTQEDIKRVTQYYLSPGYVRLDLLPPWYIRWGKAILEWLPEGLSDSLEEKVL